VEKSFVEKLKDKARAFRFGRKQELSPEEAFKKALEENAARIEKNKQRKPKKKLFGGTDTGWSNQPERDTFGSGSSFPMFLGASEPESALGIDYQNPNAGVVSTIDYLNEKKQ
jgi:hypothetical protein